MSKKLCKIVKKNKWDDEFETYIDLINHPKYICKKCGRVANKKSSVCKSIKIDFFKEAPDE